MNEKIKKWFQQNKKDAKILLACFIIIFSINSLITENLINALSAGITSAFFCAIAINAYRFWKKTFGKITNTFIYDTKNSTDDELTCKEEKEIFNRLKSNLKNYNEEEINEFIIKEIKAKNYLHEKWQIHYAQERIKKALKH